MTPQNVTIKLDSSTAATFRVLQQKVDDKGLSLNMFLQQILELLEKNGTYLIDTNQKTPKQRTWSDVWAEIDAMPSSINHPADLSSNKKYMEGYGE